MSSSSDKKSSSDNAQRLSKRERRRIASEQQIKRQEEAKLGNKGKESEGIGKTGDTDEESDGSEADFDQEKEDVKGKTIGDDNSSNEDNLAEDNVVTTSISDTANQHVPNYKLNFGKVFKELEHWDFKLVEIDAKDLGRTLSKFVAVGSIIHKLTPDEIQVIGNHNGKYANKEEVLVHDNGEHKVPDTIEGLMANGTKFFDAFIYTAMDPTVRPPCSPIELIEEKNGDIVPPTYDDIGKLTTYIFVLFFYILIRAHPPSDSGNYGGQPVPKFITSILKVTEPIAEVVDYLASFDLIKLNPSWVHFIPMNKLSQEAANRFGLGVAGYRIVSVFNIVNPDLYSEEPVPEGKINIKNKPPYIDDAVQVARSFVLAGFCWDFHPATRSPNVITKYGNINKNASNLLLECYTQATLEKLKKTGKIALIPNEDPAHTNYKAWSRSMKYKATRPIFPNK